MSTEPTSNPGEDTPIGQAGADDMVARAAALGWSAARLAEDFGTTVAELPNLTGGHLAIFEHDIAQLTKRRAREAAAASGGTRDRSAGEVADLLGVDPPAANGACHYCGVPLPRTGRCPECV